MPTPSLILVPARFKTGKLYTPLATTSGGLVLGASGDFNVTRATTATRVNASGFIEVVASGIPRLDYYTSGGTAGCPALLVEPSASNLLLRSEEFDNASWSKTGLTASTGTTTEFVAPDGNLTAESLTLSLVSGAHICNQFSRWPSGTIATASIFVKADTATKFFIANGSLGVGVFFNLSNGTIEGQIGAISGTISSFGNNYYKLTATHTATNSQTFQIGIYQTFVSGDYLGTVQFTPASANRLFVWGAQLETGSVATSYIPTTTGSVTRNADVVSVSGAVSGSIGQQSGTVYIECQSEFATNDIIVINTAGQSPGNNFVSITKTPTNVFRLTIFTSGTIILIDQASAITSFAKIAAAYASGNTALFINGTQIGSTNTTGFSFNAALNNISFIGNMVTGTKPTRIRAVALYTTRLTNTELAALTT